MASTGRRGADEPPAGAQAEKAAGTSRDEEKRDTRTQRTPRRSVTFTVIALAGVVLALGGASTASLGYTGAVGFLMKWGNKSVSSTNVGLVVMVAGVVMAIVPLWIAGKYPKSTFVY